MLAQKVKSKSHEKLATTLLSFHMYIESAGQFRDAIRLREKYTEVDENIKYKLAIAEGKRQSSVFSTQGGEPLMRVNLEASRLVT